MLAGDQDLLWQGSVGTSVAAGPGREGRMWEREAGARRSAVQGVGRQGRPVAHTLGFGGPASLPAAELQGRGLALLTDSSLLSSR